MNRSAWQSVARALCFVMVGVVASATWSSDPITLSVDNGAAAGQVNLSWTGGVPDYRVYRSTTPNNVVDLANQIATTSQTTWQDNPPSGAKFFYEVRHLCDATHACDSGQRCLDGICVCDATSCSGGCCQGTTCAAPSPASCGIAGAACMDCGAPADTCSNGQCLCGSGPQCPAGQFCAAGSCDRAPVANDQSAPAGDEDAQQPLLLTGSDPDGDPLTFSIVTPPAHGSLSALTNATATSVNVTYTPNPNYNGADSFVFNVADGRGGTDTGVVTLTVTAVNDPPVAQTKSASAQAQMKIIGLDAGLLSGMTDLDSGIGGCTPVFAVASINAVSGGAVSNVNLTAGTFDFDPNPGFTGTAVVTYTVTDNGCPGSAVSAPANVNIAVNGPAIWFVNTSAAAGNGTLAAPFNTLAAATAAMGASSNQRIFVYSGTTASGAGVVLQVGSWLVGQGVAGASFDAVMGIAPPVNTVPRPAIGGAAPIIQGTVNMNGDNTQVRGVRIQPPTASAGLVASAAGPPAFMGLVVADVPNITATGARAVDLNGVSGAFIITAVNASSAAIGINLSNVNPASGSFTVTGSGGACTAATPTCTGGTVAGTTDTGVKLTNANNVTLTRLRINGSGNFGLNGSSVSALNLDTCLLDGAHGNAPDEGSLFVANWLTSGAIANSEILGGASDNVRVVNTTGTLNRLTISNTTIRDNSTGLNGNHGLRFATNVASGTGAGVAMNLTVTNSTFRNHRNNHLDTGATGLSTVDLVLTNNTFARTNLLADTLADAVNITGDHQADVSFDVNGNTINGARLSAFNFLQSNQTTPAASMIGKFRNNVVGTSGVAGSGAAEGNGVAFNSTGLAALTVNVTGNQIRQFRDIGISVMAGDTSPRVNATITGNLVKEGDAVLALNAIQFNMGTTAAGSVSACGDIGGSSPALFNNVSGAVPGGTGEIRVRQRNSSTVQLPGLTGAVDAYLAGRNTVTNTAAVTFSGVFGNNGGLPCVQAP